MKIHRKSTELGGLKLMGGVSAATSQSVHILLEVFRKLLCKTEATTSHCGYNKPKFKLNSGFNFNLNLFYLI